MAKLSRSIALLSLLLLSARLLTACGGSDAATEITTDGTAVLASLFLSPAEVSVAPGKSIEMQVDIENLPAGDAAFGYSISLSVTATGIEISSAACLPPNAGTPSCRRWTITPNASAVPGEYGFEVRAAGTFAPVRAGQAKIRVLVPRRDASAVIAASRSHLVTSDGRLWGTGWNLKGEAGIGFTSVGFDPNVPIVLPERVEPGYVQIGTDTDWKAVVTGERTAIALKRDGTVWAWGANPEIQVTTENDIPVGSYFHFGFPSEAGRQLTPRQVTELGRDVIAISAHTASSFESVSEADVFWALKRDGTVWAWGGRPGPRYNMRLSESLAYGASDKPLAVLQAVTEDGVETPLNDVIAIAGGTRNTGRGWGVAIRRDGSVWQVGTDDGAFMEVGTGGGVTPGRAMARPVERPSSAFRVVAVAVGHSASSSGYEASFSLALTAGGQVLSWTEVHPLASPVSGLENIVAIDARGRDATAIDAAGGVWTWRFGESNPVLVGNLPPMARTAQRAPELVLTSDCLNGGGALWNTRGTRIPNFFSGCPLGEAREVRLDKTGEGSVTSEPGGQDVCGAGCTNGITVVIARGAPIVVRATPAPGWYYSGFNPECLGGRPSPSENTTCIASFVPDTRFGRLTIVVSGPGRVTSSPAGIDCGSDCRESYALGTQISLTAVADPGYRLARWRGGSYLNEIDCRDGVVTMNVTGDGVKECTADFEPIPQLRVAASANGTVTSAPAGIDCGATCAAPFALTTPVTLTATPADGYRFDGFFETACRRPITLELETLCTPMFTSTVTALLTVNVVGDGRVTSPDGNINCSRTAGTTSGICAYAYPVGTVVTLAQTPELNWALSEWSSDCTGGTARLDVARACTVTFIPNGWQPVGPAIALATEQSLSIAVDLSVASDPKIVAANAVVTAGRVDLVVRRFEGGSWTLVGTGPINDGVAVSTTVFKPAIAVNAGGEVSVAWAENGGQVRVKQWTGGAWVALADDLRVDINQQAFGIQITTAGSQVLVAWLETVGPVQGLGRMAVKRYSRFSGLWTGGSVLPTETAVTALRLTTEAAGNAMLMFVPYDVTAGSFEGPLRVLREGAFGVWENVCGGLSRPVPGGATYPNTEIGFGIAKLSFPASDPVAVFNNGDAVFALKCRANVWSGLDGSAQGQVAAVVTGESLHALSVAAGEGSGVALAWTRVRNLVGGDREIVTQVMVENANATALVVGPAVPLVSVNQGFARGYLSLTFEATGRPVLGGLIQDGGISASRVYRYVP